MSYSHGGFYLVLEALKLDLQCHETLRLLSRDRERVYPRRREHLSIHLYGKMDF